MRKMYIHMFCAPWRRQRHEVIIHAKDLYMGLSLLATSFILSPSFKFRYNKLANISHLLLVPIINNDKHIIGYYVPLTKLGKASRRTIDMHVQFLHAAMRKMLYTNLQENAKNQGMEFYQCVRRFMRLFYGQRMQSPNSSHGE